MREILPSELVWYVTGRFYVDAAGAIQDLGYFLNLNGVSASLFSGAPGEGTAHLTFASDPFRAESVTNGDLSLSLDAVGDFSLYLNQEPGATFTDPQSFAAGERIATFRRTGVVVGTTVGQAGGGSLVSLNVFSAALVWSRPFELGGATFDLRELVPNGVTQWGTASTQSIALPGFSAVVPFVGSAVAIGSALSPSS